MKAGTIPESIRRRQPFFSLSNDGSGWIVVSRELMPLCPGWFFQAYALGETLAMCYLLKARQEMRLPGDQFYFDAFMPSQHEFIAECGIEKAPENFRAGFFSVVDVAVNIALAAPEMIPALWRVVDALTPERLEGRALACLVSKPEPGCSCRGAGGQSCACHPFTRKRSMNPILPWLARL